MGGLTWTPRVEGSPSRTHGGSHRLLCGERGGLPGARCGRGGDGTHDFSFCFCGAASLERWGFPQRRGVPGRTSGGQSIRGAREEARGPRWCLATDAEARGGVRPEPPGSGAKFAAGCGKGP